MSHEREFDRTRSRTATSEVDRNVEPNRTTRSSLLEAPVQPVASGLLLRKARDGNGVADGAEHAVAAASSSSGTALPETLMRKFESSLGADLSSVRVHTGAESQLAASAVGAKAYTTGQDIHFGAGHYDPASPAGEHLIAHEVAHTVQQQGAAPARQNKLEVSSPHDAAEHDADRAADAMVTGAPARVSIAGGVARQIQRDFDPGKHRAATDTSGAGAGTVTGAGWDPQLAVGPATPAVVKLSSAMKVAGNVTNATQAPAGTTIAWGFSSLGKPGIEPLPAPASGASGSPGVKVSSLEHMTHAPIAGVRYTVPGQSERVKDAAPSAFTVAEPKVTWTMEHSNGKPADTLEIGATLARSADKLVLGDTVRLFAKIENVEKPQEVVSPELSGGGAHGAVAPEWKDNTLGYTYVLQDASTSASHELTTAKLQLKLPAGGAPRILDHDFQYRVVVSKQRFINMCSQAASKITEASLHFSGYLSKLTMAYADAYNTHSTTIGAIGQAAAATDAFTVGLVCSFIPGGIGGAVGDVLRSVTTPGAIVHGIRSMAMYGPRAALTPTPINAFAPLPDTDPLHMQSGANARAAAELAAASAIVNGWLASANSNDPALQLDFDPFAVTRKALTLADGTDLTQPVAFEAAPTTRKLQQGFFCTWINKHAANSFMSSSQFAFGRAESKLVAYGVGIGVADAKQRISVAVNTGVQENNERARKTGHGMW
jgi:hypothetical protein